MDRLNTVIEAPSSKFLVPTNDSQGVAHSISELLPLMFLVSAELETVADFEGLNRLLRKIHNVSDLKFSPKKWILTKSSIETVSAVLAGRPGLDLSPITMEVSHDCYDAMRSDEVHKMLRDMKNSCNFDIFTLKIVQNFSTFPNVRKFKRLVEGDGPYSGFTVNT